LATGAKQTARYSPFASDGKGRERPLRATAGFFGLTGGFRTENRSLIGQNRQFAASKWRPQSSRSVLGFLPLPFRL